MHHLWVVSHYSIPNRVMTKNTSANPPILMSPICSFTQLVSIKNLKNFTPPLGIKFSQRQKISKKFLDSGSHFFVTRHLRKTILVASLWIAFRQISLTKKFPMSKIYVSLFYFFLPPIFEHDKKSVRVCVKNFSKPLKSFLSFLLNDLYFFKIFFFVF